MGPCPWVRPSVACTSITGRPQSQHTNLSDKVDKILHQNVLILTLNSGVFREQQAAEDDGLDDQRTRVVGGRQEERHQDEAVQAIPVSIASQTHLFLLKS